MVWEILFVELFDWLLFVCPLFDGVCVLELCEWFTLLLLLLEAAEDDLLWESFLSLSSFFSIVSFLVVSSVFCSCLDVSSFSSMFSLVLRKEYERAH